MAQIKSTIDKVCGWERVLDWCEGVTQKIYLKAVTDWLSTLRPKNLDKSPNLLRLVGETGKGSMVMSFDTLNQIANFDSLGAGSYYYYYTNLFW
ncbi:hypothetical protein Hanom_Chr02g00113841 [Helianthus anomalus]